MVVLAGSSGAVTWTQFIVPRHPGGAPTDIRLDPASEQELGTDLPQVRWIRIIFQSSYWCREPHAKILWTLLSPIFVTTQDTMSVARRVKGVLTLHWAHVRVIIYIACESLLSW